MERLASSSSTSPGSSAPTQVPRFVPEVEFYAYVARGYDQTADSYDRIEGRNDISERVRRTSLRSALAAFRGGDRILELGCGTGRDAVAMARHGIRVIATDVSPKMVAATRARAKREGVEELVAARVMHAARAVQEAGPCDGAYSNGAVLNLEPELPEVAVGLAETLRPGSRAILTAANRISLFELAVYPLALRPRKAFRKLGGTIPIPISRQGIGKHYAVPTRFLTPAEFLSPFATSFEVESLRALQSITPPWNFVDLAARFRTVVRPLERIEDRLGDRRFLRNFGAIYVTTLRRKEG